MSNKKAVELKTKGNTAYLSKKYKDAIEYYNKAIKLDANDCTFYSNRCVAYLATQELPLALNDAESAIRLCPNWPKAYYRKGTVLMAMSKWEEAKAALQVGLQYEPGCPDLVKKIQEIDAKIAPPQAQAAQKPAASSAAQKVKEDGNAHYKDGRYDQAISCYTRAIELAQSDSEKAAYYSNRSAAQMQLQMYREVIEDCKLCLEIEEANVKALIRRAMAYEQLEIYKLARADFQKAISLDPSAKQASEGLMRCDRNIRLQAQFD
eukprot:TRINITY_DN3569_c0_g1_i1.p1 TRINITY_DN3569_c0_g1~~TRINITY_DN3569_c0_g1_i1.p1  ORF type:complete len:280 (+),score=108.38 TRINITY_DN3569_c0_g1_i1:49-840(+)